MTEPERPVGSPGNPTPEEISARLEALLKRTHTLREQRSAQAASGTALDITWPPPDRELEHYDVVDVAHGATSSLSVDRPPVKAADPTPSTTPASGDASPEFARPDWSELRLRTAGDDRGNRSSWLWVVTVLLALATVGQAAYILYLQRLQPAQVSGRLRVDGPAGAQVRVNGRAIGVAPVDHALEPGGYSIEVVHGNGVARANDVIIGLGRTVVVTVPASASAADTTTTPAPGAVAPGAAAAPAPQAAAPSGPLVTATLGAMTIVSTPPGAAVTMGGRPRGVTPVTIPLVRPGRHDVMVGGVFRQVEVRPNEVSTLRVP